MPKRWVIIPLIAILLILFFTVFGDRGLLHIHHLKQDQEDMLKRLNDMQRENELLKREIEALRTDRQHLESLARREFGLVKPNEVVYRFMTSLNASAPLPSRSPSVPLPAKAIPKN